MSKFKIRMGNQWVDPCTQNVKVRTSGQWKTLKSNDSLFINGQWVKLTCEPTLVEYPFKWVADESTRDCQEQDILLQEFDFMVVRYMWDFPSAGRDLDIQVQFEDNNVPSVDNLFVGYGGATNFTVPNNASPKDNSYLWWALDDVNALANPVGIEGVLIGIEKFITDFPSSSNEVKVGLYAVWYNSVDTGDFTVEVTTYKGGTMSKSGTNIINTGGTQVTTESRVLNTLIRNTLHMPGSSYKVGTLTYNKTTNQAILILG